MITEGHLTRHFQGQRGGRSPALIDIAQDHALMILSAEGIFDLGVVLKGGTALRKYRAGNAGRFSTDLDFGGADDGNAELILATLDGASLDGFSFRVESVHEYRRSRLHIDSPFGSPEIPARIDCSPRSPWLRPEVLPPVPMAIHRTYETQIPEIPVIRKEELLSEKLARYRRASLARDLYDLAWFARGGAFNETLVRRLTVLKVWQDVISDGLGGGPFHPDDILGTRDADDFAEEDIGNLTTPLDFSNWIEAVQDRYAFLADLDEDEIAIARCSPGDAHEVRTMIDAIGGA
ncbi:MAG: nucleotidyl transferase AbiEii/AbiGii toxin family protein [Acidimicrobiia bacterium]|nr:MAG: nucleotidyl transferase AbiEii/AbiGii toxin family protein [Acidimicrobiia bacterium]